MFYAYSLVGRGKQRKFHSPLSQANLDEVLDVSSVHPEKPMFVLGIEKTYERITTGIRSKNAFYMGTPTRVVGALYHAGKQHRHQVLYEER